MFITDLSTKINLNGEATLELDCQADTRALGRDALIFLDYDQPVFVKGYNPTIGTKTYTTISGAHAYDDPQTGKVYHLVINQAIHIPHLDHHLLYSMQYQFNDVTVKNTPKLLVRDPTDSRHALTIHNPNKPTQRIILPLALQGGSLLLNVRAPSLDKWNIDTFTQTHLTSESLTWGPTSTLYEEQEATMTNYSSHVVMMTPAMRGHIGNLVINLISSLTTDLAEVTDDDNFYYILTSNVQILSVETSLNGHRRLRKTTLIDPQTLAAPWMISPERVKHTVVMITQKGVRACLRPTLSRCSLTNDQMLWYKHILHTIFSGTMFAWSMS
jgi:hypothetical protein